MTGCNMVGQMYLCLRAHERVLIRHVPVVPHEALGADAPRVGEAGIKHVPQQPRLGQEALLSDDVPRLAQLLQRLLILPLLRLLLALPALLGSQLRSLLLPDVTFINIPLPW